MVMALIPLAMAAMQAGQQNAAGQKENLVENANAHVENMNANNAEVNSKVNAQSIDRATARTEANAHADFSASGVDANSGSPLEVMHDIATQGELAHRMTTYQGQMQAKGFAFQAVLDHQQGKADSEAGDAAAGTTLMSGLDKFANTQEWQQFSGWGS